MDLYNYFLQQTEGEVYKWHHYFEIYERYFRPWRNKEFTFVEIGVWRGGSLKMWREYFGPKARIIGIDINPEAKKFAGNGIEIHIGDQASSEFWTDFLAKVGKVDIVLDDGGHTSNQQIQSFLSLYDSLSTPGVYFVEDTHSNYWKRGQDREDKQTFLEFCKRATDYLNEWHFAENSFDLFAKDPAHRDKVADVSSLCRNTAGIHFHDSIVVFEKNERKDPWHQIR